MTDSPQGRERATTILVAEDDDALRGIVTRVFWDQGFRTLEARHGGEALHLAELAAPYLDLVVTDVIMPGTNGRKLAEMARESRPDLKVLFTTGFTRNAVVHNGVLDHGVDFIAKPFTIDQLAAKIREVLDR